MAALQEKTAESSPAWDDSDICDSKDTSLSLFFLGKKSSRKGVKTKSSEKAAGDDHRVPVARDAVREGE